MVINYQDKNLIVAYLQIYLAEYGDLTVHKVVPRKKSEPAYYEITNSEPLIVTGYYDIPTYTALALYMAYNYPNEGFPMKWNKLGTDEWVSEDYIYDGNQQELIDIIATNMEMTSWNRKVIQVPERVLSYIFNEVVTPNSSPEEILRIKQMLYEFIHVDSENKQLLTYTEDVFNEIVEIQKGVVDKYTTDYSTEYETIKMIYEKDEEDNDITDKPITSYKIGSQLNKVECLTNNQIVTGERRNNRTVRVFQRTSNLISASILYDTNGQTHTQDAIFIKKMNTNEWLLTFADDIDELLQTTITYEEPYEYNIITGYIIFTDFVKDKVVEIKKTINNIVNFPQQFINYKITGYVDPWTEIIIKGGYENNDK